MSKDESILRLLRALRQFPRRPAIPLDRAANDHPARESDKSSVVARLSVTEAGTISSFVKMTGNAKVSAPEWNLYHANVGSQYLDQITGVTKTLGSGTPISIGQTGAISSHLDPITGTAKLSNLATYPHGATVGPLYLDQITGMTKTLGLRTAIGIGQAGTTASYLDQITGTARLSALTMYQHEAAVGILYPDPITGITKTLGSGTAISIGQTGAISSHLGPITGAAKLSARAMYPPRATVGSPYLDQTTGIAKTLSSDTALGISQAGTTASYLDQITGTAKLSALAMYPPAATVGFPYLDQITGITKTLGSGTATIGIDQTGTILSSFDQITGSTKPAGAGLYKGASSNAYPLLFDLDSNAFRMPSALERRHFFDGALHFAHGALQVASLQGYESAARSIRVPWVKRADPGSSFSAFTELQAIGQALREDQQFGPEVTLFLRRELGDWRDPQLRITPTALEDLGARETFYRSLGFRENLVEFPPSSFRRILDEAEIHPEAALDDAGLGPLPFDDADAANEWATEAFRIWRTFERQFRIFVDKRMSSTFGADWPKTRAAKYLQAWETRAKDYHKHHGGEFSLLSGADFSHFITLIVAEQQ